MLYHAIQASHLPRPFRIIKAGNSLKQPFPAYLVLIDPNPLEQSLDGLLQVRYVLSPIHQVVVAVNEEIRVELLHLI